MRGYGGVVVKLFAHTSFEPDERMWRGWLADGRSLEVVWGRRWSFGFTIGETGGAINLPGLAVHFPYPGSMDDDSSDVNNRWDYGFHFFEGHLQLQWGRVNNWLPIREQPRRSACLILPWADWRHVRHDILSEPESHPYRYVLDSGEVQNVTATIKIEEREWRLLGLPWPRRVSRYIDVEFDDEVGESRGSWKGGALGCGWDLSPGENAVDALRRMERERRFP